VIITGLLLFLTIPYSVNRAAIRFPLVLYSSLIPHQQDPLKTFRKTSGVDHGEHHFEFCQCFQGMRLVSRHDDHLPPSKVESLS